MVEDREVFDERGLGLDRQAPHLPAPGDAHEALLARAERGDVEGLRETLAPLDLDEQDALAQAGDGEGQGARDRRLAGTALARDDVQPDPRPVVARIARGRLIGRFEVGHDGKSRSAPPPWRAMDTVAGMTRWEYATAPLIVHATQQILNNWGEDGWELVQTVVMPDGNLVAYFKRPKES